MRSAPRLLGSVSLLLLLLLLTPLSAQPRQQENKGPPNALQGFSQNRNEPVKIEAATLEVRDKQKQATFSGAVKVVQGDTTMRCNSLVVFYEQGGDDKTGATGAANTTNTMKQANPGPGGQQKIKKLEARGSVLVTQKDQTATGELGLFDMASNTVTLSGGVVMTQGQNVLSGDRLIVDLTSGVSRVESGKSGQGRVQGLFVPGGQGPDMKIPGSAPSPSRPNPPTPIRPF